MSPKTSIILVNWNTRDLTLACLRSLKDVLEPDGSVEIVLVDNDSSDGSADAIAEQYPDVVLLRSPENLGFARGNNLAFRHARGSYLILLNTDTIVLPNAVETLVSY